MAAAQENVVFGIEEAEKTVGQLRTGKDDPEDDGIVPDKTARGSTEDSAPQSDGRTEEEAAPEARKPTVPPEVGAPTQAMRDEHDKTHLPFRPWCSTRTRCST